MARSGQFWILLVTILRLKCYNRVTTGGSAAVWRRRGAAPPDSNFGSWLSVWGRRLSAPNRLRLSHRHALEVWILTFPSKKLAAQVVGLQRFGQPGGLPDSSRGLSVATPPDRATKRNRTPEGCQIRPTSDESFFPEHSLPPRRVGASKKLGSAPSARHSFSEGGAPGAAADALVRRRERICASSHRFFLNQHPQGVPAFLLNRGTSGHSNLCVTASLPIILP